MSSELPPSGHTPSGQNSPLPQVSFYSIEYPGYIGPQSVPLAIRNVGGQSRIDRAFKRTAQKSDALLELSLRPDNPFAHPIPGDVVGANNLVLKVVKRKRKSSAVPRPVGDDLVGEYTAQVVGIMSKTVRFRSESPFHADIPETYENIGMVDYQYFPDTDDPVTSLRQAMRNMDGNVPFFMPTQ